MTTIDTFAPSRPGLRERLQRLPKRALVAAGIAAAAMIGGAAWIAAPASSVSTDDAYLQADSSIVAPKVQGLIAHVLVRDNQKVKAGQALIEIDPRDFDQAVKAAKADVAAAEANLKEQGSRESLAAANVAAAAAAIRAAQAQSTRAAADGARFARLGAKGYVSKSQAEDMRAAAISAAADADKSRAAHAAAIEQAKATMQARGQLEAALAKAKAALSQAELNLSYTVIRAPVDGVVGDRRAQIGEYVQPGTQLLTVVPMNTLYVKANFKETQTARILVGQHARIRIDALPHTTFVAEVESFSPGSGSEFALLPFEPANGNFTRIVQRVPVRLKLMPDQPGHEKLRPGLSADVTVELER